MDGERIERERGMGGVCVCVCVCVWKVKEKRVRNALSTGHGTQPISAPQQLIYLSCCIV